MKNSLTTDMHRAVQRAVILILYDWMHTIPRNKGRRVETHVHGNDGSQYDERVYSKMLTHLFHTKKAKLSIY